MKDGERNKILSDTLGNTLSDVQAKLDTQDLCEAPIRTPDPDEALALLLAGNRRYRAEQAERPHSGAVRRLEVAYEQRPFAAILGCADSRVPPEILFDSGLGDLFIVRVAGNVADDAVLGSLEYAAAALEVPLLMVLGHGGCGAVKAAVKLAEDGEEAPGHIGVLAAAIKPAVRRSEGLPGDALTNAIRENVKKVTETLPQRSSLLRDLAAAGRLKIVGAYYDLGSGGIEVLETVGAPAA